MIQLQNGIELANAAARYIFHERLRDASEAQVPRRLQPVGYQVPDKLREAILLMERNVEEPLTQPELAAYLDLSVRQLQRIFRRHIGLTPVRYYLNLRLDRTRSGDANRDADDGHRRAEWLRSGGTVQSRSCSTLRINPDAGPYRQPHPVPAAQPDRSRGLPLG